MQAPHRGDERNVFVVMTPLDDLFDEIFFTVYDFHGYFLPAPYEKQCSGAG